MRNILLSLCLISPTTDPFIATFTTSTKSLPSLMYFPTPPPATNASAAFQFNTSTSPLVAVHPTNPKIVVSAMNLDPCNNVDATTSSFLTFFKGRFQEVGIAQSVDSGATASTQTVPLHVSLGGKISDGNTVSALQFSSSGKTLYMAGRFNDMRPNIQGRNSPLSGIWVCRSEDSGKSFIDKIISTQASDAAFGCKGTCDGICDLATDPQDDTRAYIAWDRPQYTISEAYGDTLPLTGNLFLSHTTDAGAHWSVPQQIYTLANGRACGVSLIAPNKEALIVSCMRYTPVPLQAFKKMKTTSTDRVVIRSHDGGKSWDQTATPVASFVFAPEYIPSGAPARQFHFPPLDGAETSHMAYSTNQKRLYLVWQAGSLHSKVIKTQILHPEIVLSVSQDHGKSWSNPVTVSQTHEALKAKKQDPFTTSAYQAFNGNIAYLAPDLIGIIYYDHRNFVPNSGFAATDAWLAVFREVQSGGSTEIGLDFVAENRLTANSFDANLIQTEDYLLAGIGNNLGIAASQDTFYTAFAEVGQIVPSAPYVCQNSFCAHTDESKRLNCFLKKIKPYSKE